MAFPTDPNWATDLNFAAGANPWSSTPTKTAPSAQFKAEGFKPEKPIPANVLNWLLGEHGADLALIYALLQGNTCVPVVHEYLAGSTLTIPANALPWLLYEGCGGGGAGGHGGISAAAAAERPDASAGKPSLINAGGGGGGGALRRSGIAPVVPGQAYTITVGAGGTGTDPLFGFGNSGGDSSIVRVSNGDVVAVCRGASGGQPCTPLFGAGFHVHATPTEDNTVSDNGQNQFVFARGGRPVRMQDGEFEVVAAPTIYEYMYSNQTPQAGGLGTCATWPFETSGAYGSSAPRGNDSPEGFLGGVGGTPGAHAPAGGGTTAGFYDCTGGGAGGGGGAGPYGNGGAGGNGSAAVLSGASAPPAPGSDAAANSGGGGGGGGGAGGAHVHTTAGAIPGKGGSGRMRVIYFVPIAT